MLAKAKPWRVYKGEPRLQATMRHTSGIQGNEQRHKV
jgi:hypothetical protein